MFQEQLGTYPDRAPLHFTCLQYVKTLTEAQQNGLIYMSLEEDIKQTLFSIGDQKPLGPNGYGAKIFKAAWDIIKGDFIAAVSEFFCNGKLLK